VSASIDRASLRIATLTRAHAEDLATWRYEPPYDVYDMTGAEPDELLDPAAGFQLVVLLLLRHRRGSWTLAAVWHAVLNAFGNAFFFSMVSGADRDRLNLLLGLEYAVIGAVALAVFLKRRGRDDLVDPGTVEVLAEHPEPSRAG